MSRIKKTSPLLNLSNFQTFIVDNNPLSQYFKISELGDLFTAGKNGFLIEGSTFLKPSTEIKIEVLDTEGNPLFVEPGEGIPEYYEGLSKLIGVYVYEDTPIGIGKITILGELDTYLDENGFTQPIPEDWVGIYNIKWERDIKINKNIPNETRVRFVRRPEVIIEELDQSFFSRNLVNATQTGDGLVRGVALTPSEGTTIRGYRGGIRYLIQKESGGFYDGGTFISVTGTGIQNAEVVEYLNSSSIVVATPFTSSDGLVSNFSGKNYSLSYQYNQNPVASSILGSFGRFEINHLQTFVGDVERVKVFKKSRASNVDYEVIQDTRVESSEILTTIVSGSSIDVGHFSSSYENGQGYTAFWNTSNGGTLDSSKIYKALKLQNSRLSSNLGDDIRLESGSEYSLEFYNYYDTSSNNPNDKLNVYLTSTLRSGSGISNYYLTQSLIVLTGSNEVRGANKRVYNFTPPITDNWTINFEATNTTANSYWHVGSVSLKASHELGFSPDEFNFTIPVDRDLELETFDFKFEFFDINNNYVPITLTTAKTFQSGNIGLIDKNIVIDTDKQFFNFTQSISGVEPLPVTQSINITGTKNRILGDFLITSQAFDTGGIEISPASFSGSQIYPGRLTSASQDLYSFSASLTVGDFTGALHPGTIVDRITYTLTETLSVQPFVKRFTINRLVAGATGADGDDARILSVSANTNQFFYKATDLSPNPSTQTIIIDVKKQNLQSSSVEPIRISSSSGAPAINTLSGSESGGVTKFTLPISSFTYSMGELTYAFTGSDDFLLPYSDTIKISPVKILDGFSITATNENVSFPALSTGTISGSLVGSSGSISVKVGNEVINYSSGFGNNTYSASISSSTSTGVVANTFNGRDYSISALNVDSGSLIIDIKYKDGGGTIISSSKEISYSKVRKAAPVLEFIIGNNNQSTDAKSTGAQITSFADSSLVVKEQYNGSATFLNLAAAPTINSSSAFTTITKTATLLTYPTMASGTDSVELSVTGSVSDSEGVSRTVFGNVSLTKLKKAAPSVILTATPQTQTVAATSASVQTGTLSTVSLDALEGTGSVFNSASILLSNFTGGSISTKTLTLGTIPNGVPAASASIGINYTDTEGTITSKTINVSAVKALAGASGSQGDPGSNGTNGLRTATGMVHYQLTSTTAPSNPTATSYTFSNGTFTGLTANWGTGAPTYASGNTNKYWYSFFTAVETSPGSGVGNVTFGNSTQAIGFSGLVSFTGANGVSDGSNALTFGVAGTTLINGSNISTGRITSTNIALPGGFDYRNGKYVTTGMLINLDSGSIHAKNFYISSSGDAEFKGNINVSSTLDGSAFGALATRGTVAATHIDAGAVTEAKIASSAVSNSKIATDAVTEAKIATDAVTSGKISANAVVADKIAANAIVADKIAANAVTAGKIIAGAIEADKIAASAVTADKILANTIEASKISSLNFYGKTAKFDTGDIGGWIINSDKLASPPQSGVSRLTLNPSPLIAVNNASGTPKCTIRAGDLSDLTAGSPVTINFPAVNSPDGDTSNANDFHYGSGQSFSVSSQGTYSGTISFTNGGNTVYILPNPWAGYAFVGLYYQVASDNGFSNIISTGAIAGIGYTTPGGSAVISNASVNVQISFPTAGTYYARLYWQRIIYSNTTAQTDFRAVSSGALTPQVAQSAEATELTDKGFQVVNSNLYYFRIKREGGGYYDVNTPFVQVGGKLSATDNIIAYYSDGRLKDIEGKIENPLEKIEKLNGVYYKQNKLAEDFGFTNQRRQVGLIAQEVEEVLPEVIDLAPFDMNVDNGTSKSGKNYMTLNYDRIVPLLVECIKDLKKEIDELKKNK